MNQLKYDSWVEKTSSSTQDQFCGGSKISNSEKYFIDKYTNRNILDIGCGTGKRTFPEWLKRKVNFYGVEKFDHLINASKYSDKIFKSDITHIQFQKDLIEIFFQMKLEKVEISFLLGGVINSFIDNNLRKIAFQNLDCLSQFSEYILVDTLSHFDWFSQIKKGKIEELVPELFPPQYFYSEQELYKLFEFNNLKIIESKIENIPVANGSLERKHYLLKNQLND
jgi:SAM-dependent methyltransferase